ncbi:LysR family transcriptional regulator [Ahrensia sp. R2A130]|uniref:LysR family transcriptional regulator n=1 Tax=Ahrensia sp. R2A130 TaxID=744979 RepID=UPI0012EAA5D7|nr:LysR family transcriptional regulator [Ahrensia sp. R2A130]
MNEKIGEFTIPPNWDDFAAFLSICEAGGLSAAARATGSSPATLGRRMRALERSLGRELFIRRTHGYDLTDDGQKLRRDLQPVADRLTQLTTSPAQRGLPLVKIGAGTWTMWALSVSIRHLTGDPPDVLLRLEAGEAVRSIARREITIGIRNARPTEVGVAGRKLRQVEFAAYAKNNAPERWIKVAAETPSALYVGKRSGSEIACEVSNPRLALDLALAGVGQAVLPTFVGDAHKSLQRRDEPIAELTHASWLVTHDDDRRLPEVRRVLDRIASLDASRDRTTLA